MSKLKTLQSVTLGALLVVPSVLTAQSFQAFLDSAQEVAPGGQTNSTGTGFGSLFLSGSEAEGFVLHYELVFDASVNFDNAFPGEGLDNGGSEIVRDDVVLHIHRGERGTNGPISLGIFGPDQDPEAQIVLNSDNTTTVFGSFDGGDPTNESINDIAQDFLSVPQGADTEFYFNLHGENDPAGLIRGQITAVPEPSTYGLVGIGLLTAVVLLRRKKA
ncbi:MAG: CHRD domain-containing protein [Opitutales bacterium]